MYGMIEIDGVKYIERSSDFTRVITVSGTTPMLSERVNLRGTGHYLLKAIARDTIVNNASTARRFLFRLGNSDGGIYYSSGGLQSEDGRVLDTNYFGNGQFPRPFVPPIFFTQNGQITMEIESIASAHPYDLHINFIGSILIPV